MNEIAKAYVQIVPTTKGIQGQLEKELSGVGDAAGGKAGTGFLGGMKGAIAKGAAVVGTAAVAALGAVAKQAVDSYADYEQLTGGVETLFKGSSDTVMQYAENAYKTAGLSANQYMETVTSFSASLLQSLGGDTEKAANIGDLAITDMADNANKMGSSMESIQNAYQGFAKQNYTMLDNLKLGYGGTKEEMMRLLADAEKLSGVKYDISSLSDVYEAIHVIQTEMGITGTTALEASETISGSAAQMKSAWQNLLTGIADDNADFETLVSNFTESLVTYADNLVPRIGVAIEGIGTLLTSFASTVVPKVIEYITANLPQLIETGITLVVKLVEGLMSALPQLVQAAPQIVTSVVKTVIGLMPELLKVGKQMVEGVWQGIKNAASWFTSQVKSFFKGIVDAVKKTLGIASPSKVFAGIGGYMAEGIGVGFSDEIGAVKDDIARKASGISANVALNTTATHRSAIASGAGGFNAASAVADGLQSVVNKLNGSSQSVDVRVYLDSREIKAGQTRLARAVG